MRKPQKINVYSPETPEGDSIIIANKEALIGLKEAIERVLDEGSPTSLNVMTGRGEDHKLIVARSNERVEEQLKDPFSHPVYAQVSEGMDQYKALVKIMEDQVPGIEVE